MAAADRLAAEERAAADAAKAVAAAAAAAAAEAQAAITNMTMSDIQAGVQRLRAELWPDVTWPSAPYSPAEAGGGALTPRRCAAEACQLRCAAAPAVAPSPQSSSPWSSLPQPSLPLLTAPSPLHLPTLPPVSFCSSTRRRPRAAPALHRPSWVSSQPWDRRRALQPCLVKPAGAPAAHRRLEAMGVKLERTRRWSADESSCSLLAPKRPATAHDELDDETDGQGAREGAVGPWPTGGVATDRMGPHQDGGSTAGDREFAETARSRATRCVPESRRRSGRVHSVDSYLNDNMRTCANDENAAYILGWAEATLLAI